MLKIAENNSLQKKYPKIGRQWHPIKNGSLTPKDVTPGSHKKVWWKCDKGHEWEGIIKDRNRGRGCPYCAGKKASEVYNLEVTHPEIAKQWHPIKNGLLTPKDVTPGTHKKVWWKCDKGHEWETSIAKRTGEGRNCGKCSRSRIRVTRDYNLEVIHPKIAKEWHPTQNGSLTPKAVTPGSSRKVWWKCDKGHEWDAQINNRTNGNKCPYCMGKKATENNNLLEKYPQIAKQWHAIKNGLLTPKDVTPGSQKKAWWRCDKGHIWETSVYNRGKGHDCPECAGTKKKSIEEIKKLAISKGGKCLSNGYINAHTKLKWQCSNGHVWEATYNNVQQGKWCRICSIEKVIDQQRLGIEEMKELARRREGRCLSDDYVNTDTKLKWMCSKGHIWEAIPDAVKRGTWCPVCNTSKSENICRLFFENLFNNKFPPSWPNWLRNKSGQVLQLDGYCESLGVAFEYQGIQHYSPDEYFNRKRKNSFKKRREDDERKNRLCQNRGIKLFQIPYLIFEKATIKDKVSSLRNFVKSEAKLLRISIPKHIEHIVIDANKIYEDNEIEKIIFAVSSKGGRLLEGNYGGGKSLFGVKCHKGHIWTTRADHLKRGVWCPYCSGNVKLTLEDLKTLAEQKGGQCLSEKYINNLTKLKWRCKEGHEWIATPAHIKDGTWCSICAGNKRKSIEEFIKIAHERNGECLSKQYINMHTKLKWRCKNGHEWMAIPNSIKRGKWCPYCSGNVKLTLEEMKTLAIQRGGYCLSKEYINNHTKLKWRCRLGHEWEATPTNLKNGAWCPKCATDKRKLINFSNHANAAERQKAAAR